MQKCRICGGAEFYKEAGYYFCQTCQTQNEDIREEVLELRVDSSTRLRKTRIRQLRSDRSGEELGWTSWELYNFVLIGLTNELLELGVPTDIKLTVLQLWATYLGNIEVAFISTKKKCMPKLARRYKKRDAEIIYGKVQSQKRYRKRKRAGSSTNTSVISGGPSEGSSSMRELNKNKRLLATADYDRYLQSQGSSEADGLSMFSQSAYSVQSSSVKSSDNEGKVQFSSHAKEEAKKIKRLSKNLPRDERTNYRAKHVTTRYKMGPHMVTPMRLWAIIYLALRIHDQPIQLGDMLRYGREGHLSYYKLDHLLPPEISLTASERSFLTQNVEITHKGLRRIVAGMAKFLGVWDVACPNFLPLVSRYCQELGLPRGVRLYAERLIALSPPKMAFDRKTSCIPNYEGRAMAFIVVVLKTLLGLDGVTEYRISKIAEKINSIAIERGFLSDKLFSFDEWQRYIECRKTILVHAHFPTKMKYSPDSDGIDDLYLKFLEFITSKSSRQEPEMKNSKHFLPEELINAMTRHVTSLNIDDLSPQAIDIFPPSLTPLHSYFQHLLDHPLYDIPNVARDDFLLTKVGYMTKPDSLIELAMKCDIELEIIDSNVHFLEKIVPPFEQARMANVNELKQLIDVEDDSKDEYETGSESLNDYLHSKIPCSVKVDFAKKEYYDDTRSAKQSAENIDAGDNLIQFTFAETLPNGKLAIPSDDDSESDEDAGFDNSTHQASMLVENNKVWDKYNLQLSQAEKESVRKSTRSKRVKTRVTRNGEDEFVKGSGLSARMIRNGDDSFPAKEEASFYSDTEANLTNQTRLQLENTRERESPLGRDINISDIDFDIDINDIDIASDFLDSKDFANLSDITFFGESKDGKSNNVKGDHRFFRPFKEYWMYHCVFSRVKPKNFSVFEKSLPRSFRWLLNECANIVEMTADDLYEEVCLIESYHSHPLRSSISKEKSGGNLDPLSKIAWNFILNKW